MRLVTLIFMLAGLVMACGPGEGTERKKSYTSGSEGTGGKEGGDDTEEDSGEETPALEPAEISGSFLVCTPVSDDEEFAGQYGCGLRDEDKAKLDSAAIRDGLNLFAVDEADEEAAIENLDRDTDGSPWHVRFTTVAPATIASIKAKIKVGDEEFEFSDDTWDEDDATIEDELQAYRDELSQAVEDAEGKADVL